MKKSTNLANKTVLLKKAQKQSHKMWTDSMNYLAGTVITLNSECQTLDGQWTIHPKMVKAIIEPNIPQSTDEEIIAEDHYLSILEELGRNNLDQTYLIKENQ